jgi:hypothetical protein
MIEFVVIVKNFDRQDMAVGATESGKAAGDV